MSLVVNVCLQNQLDLAHLCGSGTFRTLCDRKFDPFTFYQAAIPIGNDGRMVDKDIIAAFARQKAIALLIIEPLDCSDYTLLAHCWITPFKSKNC